ncbi:MAG: phosphonopyruvate decarboxylase [Rhodospirillaceae bacterium]|nr:phosphonopyruvate decarboxylase [Rhodospirillaceae bacterium]
MTREEWSKVIFDKLVDADVTLFSYVPDFGNASLVEMADEDNRTRTVLLSSEQEGVALCAGADLVGGRGVLLMQSSGVGNVPNMLSLVQGGRFPMLMIVTMRGEYGEQNPWQYPMGRAVVPVLEAMGIQCIRVERDDELDQAIDSTISASYVAGQGVALILTQKFLGAKAF